MAAARLREVAALAGVSVKTVSNVINGVSGRVSEETAARVRQAVEELGYRPNLSARRLRSGHSRVIALVVPDLRNAFFAELAASVIGCARARGYTVFIEESGGDPDAELEAATGLGDPLIEGVILSPLSLDEARLGEMPRRLPLVLLNDEDHPAACEHVMFDNAAATRLMTEHLLAQGFRTLGIIGKQDSPPQGAAPKRLLGVQQALAAAGMAFDPAYSPTISSAPYSRDGGVEGMAALLKLEPRPDAVFCFADVLAIGALYEASRHGLHVPADLALAGFDGIQDARFMVPTLTTIATDFGNLAEVAVDSLIERILSPTAIGHRHRVSDYRLVVRESTQHQSVAAAH